jgi:hypothetical protein
LVGGLACRPEYRGVPPALYHWPEPAFAPSRQCHGDYAVPDLERYLAHASLALWLPGTVGVDLDTSRRRIRVAVEDVSTGREVELVLRGAAVPRRAVLLELSPPAAPRARRATPGR